jgi:4-carboxymuconolactone decarboxylase
MESRREAGLRIVSEMLSPGAKEALETVAGSGQFGASLSELSVENLFGALWARPGLSRRDRSLVTLGILIALRASEELQIHVRAGLANGLTKAEIDELICHASGYAGFPAAVNALSQANKVFSGS